MRKNVCSYHFLVNSILLTTYELATESFKITPLFVLALSVTKIMVKQICQSVKPSTKGKLCLLPFNFITNFVCFNINFIYDVKWLSVVN